MLGPGTVLQRGYTIERILGKGGMGAVYLARQTHLAGRRVAIKETHLVAQDPEQHRLAREQFRREAEILASIEHPGLVDVKDYFEEGGAQYLVMAFIDGETLEGVLNRAEGWLAVPQVLDWADQICDVLTCLHQHDPPVIVRDLKPTNIMLDANGRIHLIDFGIARTFDPHSETASILKGAGSVGFAPPEQFGGTRTDARSDIYALGATLYCLLARRIAPWSVSLATGEQALHAPSVFNASVPRELDAIILRMMALRKEDRYQTAVEARQALQAIRDGVGQAGPSPPIQVVPRFCTQCGMTLVPHAPNCAQCGTALALHDPGAMHGASSGAWSPPPPSLSVAQTPPAVVGPYAPPVLPAAAPPLGPTGPPGGTPGWGPPPPSLPAGTSFAPSGNWTPPPPPPPTSTPHPPRWHWGVWVGLGVMLVGLVLRLLAGSPPPGPLASPTPSPAVSTVLSSPVPSPSASPSPNPSPTRTASPTPSASPETAEARVYVGLHMGELTWKIAREKKYFKLAGGVLVTKVLPRSPAERAGMQVGDILVKFDGRKVRNGNQVLEWIRAHQPGDRIVVVVWRNGRYLSGPVVVAPR